MVYFFSRIFISRIFVFPFLGKKKGIKNLPNQPYIFAANHASYIDDFLLPSQIVLHRNRRFHIFVNSRYYGNFFLRKFFNHFGCFPVDVKKDVKDDKKRKETNDLSTNAALECLKKGHDFILFPEGGRSSDGKLKKAKIGVAKVALTSKVPVIPVGIRGSYEIMPKGAVLPKLKKADLVFGKPISFEKYYGKEKDYKALEEVTTIIMKEIAKLTGQRYDY